MFRLFVRIAITWLNGIGRRRSPTQQAGRFNARRLTAGERRIQRFFEKIEREATRELRRSVPVRTGLMKRRTGRRGDGKGRFRTVEIYSDAKNTSGKEYARYVERYNAALNEVFRRTNSKMESKRISIVEYRLGRYRNCLLYTSPSPRDS